MCLEESSESVLEESQYLSRVLSSRQNFVVEKTETIRVNARVEILISPDRRSALLNDARPPHEAEKNTKLWNLINQNHLGSGSQ